MREKSVNKIVYKLNIDVQSILYELKEELSDFAVNHFLDYMEKKEMKKYTLLYEYIIQINKWKEEMIEWENQFFKMIYE